MSHNRAHISSLLEQAASKYRVGDQETAATLYAQVLEHDAEQFNALLMLGIIGSQRAQYPRAVALFERALKVRPNAPLAWENLGSTLGRMERYPGAARAFRRSLEGQPNSFYCIEKLARLECHLGHYESARGWFKRALEIKPHDAGLYHGLGICLRHLGYWDRAVAALQRGLSMAPERADILSELLFVRRSRCDWAGIELLEGQFRAAARQGKPGISPFLTLGISDNRIEQRRAAQAWGEKFLPDNVIAHSPHRKNRITIGYLSPDFIRHPLAQQFASLPRLHDREKFQVFGYRLLPATQGPTPEHIVNAFDEFTSLYPLGPAAAARKIHRDGVDILVDFVGYTADAAPGIVAHRPAPIQVSWLGYPGTSGASYLDYLIADHVVIPDAHAKDYSEAIIRMPGSYELIDHQRLMPPATLTRDDCMLPNDKVVFACFNQPWKISPAVFETWMRILQAVPGSVLWLLDHPPNTVQRLQSRATAAGVEAKRLIAAPRRPQEEFLDQLRLADLFLDTLPCNAHSTALDALWMGCPVLTCSGSTLAGRVAASLLHACKLPELVMETMADYEQRAIALGRNPNALRAIREYLQARHDDLPLFDTHRFIHDLEYTFERMMHNYWSDNAPSAFDVPG